jgi:TatD DNase family protein
MLVDTHCHIHDPEYNYDQEEVIATARDEGIASMICVGTSAQNSQTAVDFCSTRAGIYASVGLHPHDAKLGEDDFELLASLALHPKVVAIGECGLDYYYSNSPKIDQKQALEYQIQLAMSLNLPLIFHVRDPKEHDFISVGEAFQDFFAVIDLYPGIRGVVHSFTGGVETLKEVEKRGMYVGINGIATFTKDENQKNAYVEANIDQIVLETDSPFLTPSPLRGSMNVPANVRLVAACLAEMRDTPLNQLIEATTRNAHALFNLR